MPHKEYTNISILEELKIFAGNSKPLGDDERIFLNLALINHSCSPNATFGKLQELEEDNNNAESHQSALGSLQAGLSSLFAAFSFSNPSVNPKKMKVELRAVKDIPKGEEITICSVQTKMIPSRGFCISAVVFEWMRTMLGWRNGGDKLCKLRRFSSLFCSSMFVGLRRNLTPAMLWQGWLIWPEIQNFGKKVWMLGRSWLTTQDLNR